MSTNGLHEISHQLGELTATISSLVDRVARVEETVTDKFSNVEATMNAIKADLGTMAIDIVEVEGRIDAVEKSQKATRKFGWLALSTALAAIITYIIKWIFDK